MTLDEDHYIYSVFILGISGGGEFTPQKFEIPPPPKNSDGIL